VIAVAGAVALLHTDDLDDRSGCEGTYLVILWTVHELPVVRRVVHPEVFYPCSCIFVREEEGRNAPALVFLSLANMETQGDFVHDEE
jgi:hypothetical protein